MDDIARNRERKPHRGRDGAHAGRAFISAEELEQILAAHAVWHRSGGEEGARAALQNRDLRNADLSKAGTLAAADVAGSDLAGATLPEETVGFDKIGEIAAVSGIARPLFLFLMVSTAFVLMTVFSTPDVALFTNATSAVLPNLSTNIPAASLFWVAPIVLLFLFVYVHFYIARIWEALAELPAVYPDGTPGEEKAHPWLFVRLVRLRDGRRAIGFEETVLIVLLWGSVPVTLLGIWWAYLPLRDWPVTLLQVVIVLVTVLSALTSFQRAVSVLRRRPYRLPRTRTMLGLGAFLVVTSALFVFSPNLFDAYTKLVVKPEALTSSEVTGVRPKRVKWLVADLEDGDLSAALLKDRDLRYAQGHRANLAQSNLSDASLTGSDFQRGNFREAILESADLRHANLDSADFENACLREADLTGADLEDADFRGAYLGKADLQRAYLGRAQLQYANLQGADLEDADLEDADLENAVFYCFADHRNDPKKDMVTTCANLKGANLKGARLAGTDLRFAKNLTQTQLDGACGDARLPPGLSVKACTGESAQPVPNAAAVDQEPPNPDDNPCLHELMSDFWLPEDENPE